MQSDIEQRQARVPKLKLGTLNLQQISPPSKASTNKEKLGPKVRKKQVRPKRGRGIDQTSAGNVVINE